MTIFFYSSPLIRTYFLNKRLRCIYLPPYNELVDDLDWFLSDFIEGQLYEHNKIITTDNFIICII